MAEASISNRDHDLSISLFGPTLFHRSGEPLQLGLKGTTLELLGFLLAHAGHEMRRECIAERFWSASSEARQRSSLNSAIWRIGRKLPVDPGLRLITTDATLSMLVDPAIPVDARDLCILVHEACGPDGLAPDCAARLEAAIAASDQPFLDGFDADWTLAE
ncbi:MAG: hypothetical protein KDJ77_17220, partial [Rhodobiaceae bacterium]|nr:hypothetical protein [Rhodobiaceae bacterium]